jgi:anti-anti-sigma factor
MRDATVRTRCAVRNVPTERRVSMMSQNQSQLLDLHVARGAHAVTVLALTGELTRRTIGRLQAVLSPLVSAPGTVLLDVGVVHSLDAFGLGALMRALETARAHGGDLALIAAPAHVTGALAVAGLAEALHVHRDLNEALR